MRMKALPPGHKVVSGHLINPVRKIKLSQGFLQKTAYRQTVFWMVLCLLCSTHGFAQQSLPETSKTGLQQKDTIPVNQSSQIELIYTSSPATLSAASTAAGYSKDILKTPATNLKNTLTGRLAGVYSLQASGQPGADGVSLSVRGYEPIVIIDGIVANLTTFDLEEIESVTVLKDAVATAMLGVRGAHGAILVTTKKGKPKTHQISFTAQTATQKPIGFPKTLNAYDYASLRNEALRNDGIDSLYSGLYYSSTALNAYKDHTDPYNFPDVNWRDMVTKSSSMMNRYTLSASGGSDFARYFVSLEHVSQSGFFKTVDSNSYNTNNTFKSYVIRSNVDVNITKKLTGGIYLLGRILNGNEPGATASSIISGILSTPANAYPALNADNSFGGNQLFQNNLLAQTIGSGYRQNYKRDMMVNIYLKRSLDEILPGLWAKAKVSYYSTLSENVTRNKSFAVFQKSGTTYTQFGTNGAQANGNGIAYQGKADYEELSIGYDRDFHNTHGINAIVLVNRDNSTNGSDLPYTITGGSGRIAYNYKGKYTFESAFALNGSNRYPGGGNTKRGFFPSVGLGWNLDKEAFLSRQQWLSGLRLFASYGLTGWDNPGYFVYYPRFYDGPGAVFGTGAGTVTSITEGTFPNATITWEKSKKFNIGVEGTVLNNKLNFRVEYYNNSNYDLLMQRGTNSTTIGNSYPDENIGKNRYSGIEAQIGWHQQIQKLQYFVLVNAATVGSKVTYMDEVSRPYGWMKRTGQPVGQLFGFVADGLFQSQADINGKATIAGYTPKPGDIRYKDLNGDGVINENDQTAIGKKQPLILYGATLGMSWKGFDLSVLVQGVANRTIYMSGDSYWAFQNNGVGQAYSHNLNRWTPENAANATYPRLSYGTNINNQAVSSYWVRNGNYLRLRNAEIGYSLPDALINRIKLQSVRLFANGYNLLTVAPSSLDGRDPEIYTGGYPIQRVFNFGINIKF